MILKPLFSHADALLAPCIDSLEVVLVAHVLAPRGQANPLQQNCPETEHFTPQEFSEIYKGIVDAGFYIRKVFFSELDFLKDIIEKPQEYSSTLVFNLCRNGTGMNKKTVVPAICDLLGVPFTSSEPQLNESERQMHEKRLTQVNSLIELLRTQGIEVTFGEDGSAVIVIKKEGQD